MEIKNGSIINDITLDELRKQNGNLNFDLVKGKIKLGSGRDGQCTNDDCANYHHLQRHYRNILQNNTTQWTVVLGLFSGHFEGTWTQPAGYVTGTGVTVCGVDLRAGNFSCALTDEGAKCQSTRVKMSIKCRNDRTGKEVDFHFPDKVVEAGKYWVCSWFGIQDGSKADDHSLKFEMYLLDSEFNLATFSSK